VCKEEADAIVFVFSFTDPSGLSTISTNLPTYMNDKSKPAPIVIGTKYEHYYLTVQKNVNINNKYNIYHYFRYCSGDFTAKITIDDIKEFEKTQKITILKINKTDTSYDLKENELTAYFLNVICEQLWIRDQNYILNQEMGSSQII
jgi:hypothetical protein